jgi:uncharacterized membrane protein
MQQTNQTGNVEQSYRTLFVIWFALLNSQLMLLVVLYFAKPEIFRFDFSKPLLGENPAMIIAFAILGVSAFLLSFIQRNKLFKKAIAEQKVPLLQNALIVACALCEATSLFGICLAFGFDYSYFFLWFALGILGTILHFPRRDNLFDASYKR